VDKITTPWVSNAEEWTPLHARAARAGVVGTIQQPKEFQFKRRKNAIYDDDSSSSCDDDDGFAALLPNVIMQARSTNPVEDDASMTCFAYRGDWEFPGGEDSNVEYISSDDDNSDLII
jgi:hypothetical protein